MKRNTITLNIGLTDSIGEPVPIHKAIAALQLRGFAVINSRVACGTWQGVIEYTLVVECAFALPCERIESILASKAAVFRLTMDLGQTCIAIRWQDGCGELVPQQIGTPFDTASFYDILPA